MLLGLFRKTIVSILSQHHYVQEDIIKTIQYIYTLIQSVQRSFELLSIILWLWAWPDWNVELFMCRIYRMQMRQIFCSSSFTLDSAYDEKLDVWTRPIFYLNIIFDNCASRLNFTLFHYFVLCVILLPIWWSNTHLKCLIQYLTYLWHILHNYPSHVFQT